MADAVALGTERTQLFEDLYDGKIPKRVPVGARLSIEFAIQYAGQDLTTAQWNTAWLEPIFEKICQDFTTDLFPVTALRFPSYYKLLGAKNFVMGSGGFLQHPEIEGLHAEEYDAFIASPYDCVVETVLPRLNSALDTDPHTKALNFAKAFKAYSDEMANRSVITGNLTKKYGFAAPRGMPGFCEAPFDFVGDLLRGFTGIAKDVRRMPDKVEAAAEAALPLMIKMGLPPLPSKYGATFVPLHLAPYMREKDFAKLYWPTFKKMVETLDEAGQPCLIFAEQDWMRYLDYLNELPESTRMMFEFGDPKLAKEKVGQKHIITGFYPIVLLKTGSKQECIDKAKELIDILAPGGKYYFGFDKTPITLDSVNIENLIAVLEYVATNANY